MKALVSESDDRILGFTMIGAEAGEVMAVGRDGDDGGPAVYPASERGSRPSDHGRGTGLPVLERPGPAGGVAAPSAGDGDKRIEGWHARSLEIPDVGGDNGEFVNGRGGGDHGVFKEPVGLARMRRAQARKVCASMRCKSLRSARAKPRSPPRSDTCQEDTSAPGRDRAARGGRAALVISCGPSSRRRSSISPNRPLHPEPASFSPTPP